MTDGAVGITFHETMAGGFSLGVSDPEDGRRKGEAASAILSLSADVEIADLRRFCDEESHAGRLAGQIDFPFFGRRVSGKNGVFNLFSPGGEPGLKLMVYELGFEREGQAYYLAGRKEVRNDPGFDLWKDTTTLYTRLHQGVDKTGPVVGAGVLTLGPEDLLKLVSTIRVTNAQGLTEKSEALAEFTRFFLGELADSYLKTAAPGRGPIQTPGA
jgi:hypothetical protein